MTRHRSTEIASAIAELLMTDFDIANRERTVIGVAGESGSGKTRTAGELAYYLRRRGLMARELHQDDYFHRPPRTNHEHRERDLSSVGPQEVNLALLAEHVAAFRAGARDVVGPRVVYPENRFALDRRFDFAGTRALVVEGTYVLTLPDLDVRVFLEATHVDTRERRRKRARDIEAPFVERVLEIEHEIVKRQREVADIVIDRRFMVRRATRE
jgi:uridine kinase